MRFYLGLGPLPGGPVAEELGVILPVILWWAAAAAAAAAKGSANGSPKRPPIEAAYKYKIISALFHFMSLGICSLFLKNTKTMRQRQCFRLG